MKTVNDVMDTTALSSWLDISKVDILSADTAEIADWKAEELQVTDTQLVYRNAGMSWNDCWQEDECSTAEEAEALLLQLINARLVGVGVDAESINQGILSADVVGDEYKYINTFTFTITR
jgi:hypothetical protein